MGRGGGSANRARANSKIINSITWTKWLWCCVLAPLSWFGEQKTRVHASSLAGFDTRLVPNPIVTWHCCRTRPLVASLFRMHKAGAQVDPVFMALHASIGGLEFQPPTLYCSRLVRPFSSPPAQPNFSPPHITQQRLLSFVVVARAGPPLWPNLLCPLLHTLLSGG